MEWMEENKKSASPKKNFGYSLQDSIVCNKGWHVPTCGFSPQPTLRGSYHFFGFLQAALQATPFACMESEPQYAISDGGAASRRDCRGCPTGSMVPTGDADGKRAISPTFVTHPGIARRGNELKIEINQCRI